MFYEFFIAFRYLTAKRKQTFISVISAISIGGVLLGVMTLIVVLSVMNGFRQDLEAKLLGFNAHAFIKRNSTSAGMENYQEIEDLARRTAGVIAASSTANGEGMIGVEGGIVEAVRVIGIAPLYSEVSDLERNIVRTWKQPSMDGMSASPQNSSKLESLLNPKSSHSIAGRNGEGENGIILGKELAANLGTFPGDVVSLGSLESTLFTPLGLVPILEDFRVTAIFESGYFEYDAKSSFISLEMAQNVFDLQGANRIQIRVERPSDALRVVEDIRKVVDSSYQVGSWRDMNRSLYSALELERVTMFVLLAFIVVVAAFGIVSSLVMMVMEKTPDIGVLKSMGARPRSILLIFFCQGAIISLIGTLLGSLAGYGLARLLAVYHFIRLPGDVFYSEIIPVKLELTDFLAVCLSSVIVCLVAAIYPAYQASRLGPVEAIREE